MTTVNFSQADADSFATLADLPGADAAGQILAGKRILVIEDEALVALDMVSALEQAGAENAGSVGKVSEALALVERVRWDAVLLDANLRGQAVDDIATALSHRNVPFAFVTGYGRESLPKAFAAVELLAKPFSHQELIDTAARLVRPFASLQKPAE